MLKNTFTKLYVAMHNPIAQRVATFAAAVVIALVLGDQQALAASPYGTSGGGG